MEDKFVDGNFALKYEQTDTNEMELTQVVGETLGEVLPTSGQTRKQSFTLIKGGLDEVKIKAVTSKEELKAFIELPYKIYENDPQWPGQDDNVEFERLLPDNVIMKLLKYELFLAYKMGEAVGRIMVCINDIHNETWDQNIGFFGFFESIDDQEVADKLFQTAENWLKIRGKNGMYGPFNATVIDTIGLLIDGFDEIPTCGFAYNPPYYSKLMDKYGLSKVKDIVELKGTPVKMAEIAEIKQTKLMESPFAKNITIRSVDYDNFEDEMKTIQAIFNISFVNHFFHHNLPEDTFLELMRDYCQIVPEDLYMIAEYDGKPIGFTALNIDYNQELHGKRYNYNSQVTRVKHYVMGILPEYQNKGVSKFFMTEIARRLQKYNFEEVSFGWVLEDNYGSLGMVKWIGGELNKVYRVYEKVFN